MLKYILGVLLLVTGFAIAGPLSYYTEVSATATNTATSFATPLPQGARGMNVWNDGPNDVWINVNTTTAVATAGGASVKIVAGSTYQFLVDGAENITGFGAICAATQTATVRVHAW